MKAVSMNVSIPVEEKCNKNCPYCISKMTRPVKVDENLWGRNLDKAVNLANLSSTTSIIMTGKHDPLQNMDALLKACDKFNKFPVEIQTNGLLLDAVKIVKLYHHGVDTIAISIDSMKQLESLSVTIDDIHTMGMTIRLAFNVTDILLSPYTKIYAPDKVVFDILLREIQEFAKEHNVSQISFRSITIPTNLLKDKEYMEEHSEAANAVSWIKEHADNPMSRLFIAHFNEWLKDVGEEICRLPFGAVIYMHEDISYTYFDYCIQDKSGEEDIRSLIYFDDGHLSRSWNGSNYGRIF